MATFTEHSAKYGQDNSKEIFYYAAGPLEGPLLIFIHGWPANGRTWSRQLTAFSALGFRCIAPDMPGYGRSTVTRTKSDYSQESLVEGLVALLAHTGRDAAVWVSHDWGSGVVWSFAKHHPSKCLAIASLTIPYHTIEMGIDHLVRYSNRAIYPVDTYPDAQWSYMRYYDQSFDEAVKWMEDNSESLTKLAFTRETKPRIKEPSFTATTVKDGGWFGGAPGLPPADQIPVEKWLISEEALAEHTAQMKKNGYFAPNAYYGNNTANIAYNNAADVDPVLRMPVLYIEGRYDEVCDSAVSRLAEPQRRLCEKLTEVSIPAGHWVYLEVPEETNAALARWLATEVGSQWPGAWSEKSLKHF